MLWRREENIKNTLPWGVRKEEEKEGEEEEEERRCCDVCSRKHNLRRVSTISVRRAWPTA